jgi:hypothetical protein
VGVRLGRATRIECIECRGNNDSYSYEDLLVWLWPLFSVGVQSGSDQAATRLKVRKLPVECFPFVGSIYWI